MIDCASTHIMFATAGTDHTFSITDAARKTASTGQDYSTDLNVAGAPATTSSTDPTPYPTTTAAHSTHPPTDALVNTFARILHTITAATHPWHDTLHTGATLMTTSWTATSLAQGTLMILPANCIHGRNESHIHGQQSPIDPSIRRKSLFRSHSQILSQNEMMTLIL